MRGVGAGAALHVLPAWGVFMTDTNEPADTDDDVRDWDLEERDGLLAEGSLTDEDVPDPTIPMVEADQ